MIIGSATKEAAEDQMFKIQSILDKIAFVLLVLSAVAATLIVFGSVGNNRP